MKTPVLLLLFNRPDETKQLIECLEKIKPSRIFIVADGHRPLIIGEKEKCNEVKDIVSNLNWTCEVNTNFRSTNLGCRESVSQGIDWFFDHVEEGIILEDDCIPHESFFNYCTELLEKYRFDNEVMHIGGNNFQFGKARGDSDYYFSIYNHVWGWATWRRAWSHYNDIFELDKIEDELRKFIGHRATFKYFEEVFSKVAAKQIDTWDFIWTYSCWKAHGLSIIPNKNLVTNIGFGHQATHTRNVSSVQSKIPALNIGSPLKHPKQKKINRKADKYTFYTILRALTIKDRINMFKRKLLFK